MEISKAIIILNTIRNHKRGTEVSEALDAILPELNELQRLLEIGKAVEWATDKKRFGNVTFEYNCEFLHSKSEDGLSVLLEAYRQRKDG